MVLLKNTKFGTVKVLDEPINLTFGSIRNSSGGEGGTFNTHTHGGAVEIKDEINEPCGENQQFCHDFSI